MAWQDHCQACTRLARGGRGERRDLGLVRSSQCRAATRRVVARTGSGPVPAGRLRYPLRAFGGALRCVAATSGKPKHGRANSRGGGGPDGRPSCGETGGRGDCPPIQRRPNSVCFRASGRSQVSSVPCPQGNPSAPRLPRQWRLVRCRRRISVPREWSGFCIRPHGAGAPANAPGRDLRLRECAIRDRRAARRSVLDRYRDAGRGKRLRNREPCGRFTIWRRLS
jgi:hypothetical protein